MGRNDNQVNAQCACKDDKISLLTQFFRSPACTCRTRALLLAPLPDIQCRLEQVRRHAILPIAARGRTGKRIVHEARALLNFPLNIE